MAGPDTGLAAPTIGRALLSAPLFSLLVATFAASALFHWFPSIDLFVASLAYDPASGFPLKEVNLLRHLRQIGSDLPVVTGVAGAGLLLLVLLLPRRPSLASARVGLFLALVQVVGPGLVVNGIAKPLFSRPRPHQIAAFGGDHDFVAAWTVSSCDDGCASFVSGEAAGAASLLALVLLAPAAWRMPLATVFAVFAAAVSFNRILFGGHFLSDVVIAWGIVAMIVVALHRTIVQSPPPALTDVAIEARIRGAGLRLRAALRAGAPAMGRILFSSGTAAITSLRAAVSFGR